MDLDTKLGKLLSKSNSGNQILTNFACNVCSFRVDNETSLKVHFENYHVEMETCRFCAFQGTKYTSLMDGQDFLDTKTA